MHAQLAVARTACFALAVVSACIADDQVATPSDSSKPLEWIRVSDDSTHFVRAESKDRFIVWGVNYDHDGDNRLIEDYWHDEWESIQEDFREIKSLNANVVRVHLQLAKFMDSPTDANSKNLQRLAKLVELAEETGLYLDVTGLGCYHKQDVPTWYDEMAEADRWKVQEQFWREVAKVCKDSPAIFCYDLMNEPIFAGTEGKNDWLADPLGDKHFVQRITRDMAGRSREEVAKSWLQQLTSAIREVDSRHMITVGVIPWSQVFPGAKPVFYAPGARDHLDFVSVHFYPKKKDSLEESLAALRVYEVGKPLVIEEIFPLHSSLEATQEFIDASSECVDGWVSFYWGKTIEENKAAGDITGAIVAAWLTYFRDHSPLVESAK